MSKKELRLRDFIRVKPDESITSMDEAQITIFKDSAIGRGKKGLLVTFDLSHSGRKINNRIYPPWGQRDGANSWTMPFGRPIILNHDADVRNTIGRFVSVEWQSLEDEAITHLGDIRAYLEVKKSLEDNDPKSIYKTFNKYGLFQDKLWPGVGKLVAKALITDEDAIERFLDGRYLTFSAGSRTNAYTCMVCGSGWHAGDICDHRPGLTDEDGNTAYFLTGLFMGDEGSVVNMPADNFSQVSSLELQDIESAVSFSDAEWANISSDEDTFVLTDSKMEVTSMAFGLQDLVDLEPETIVKKLSDGTLKLSLEDLTGDTQFELQWLIRIHDSLHHRYDGTVRGELGDSMDTIPTDVFKLHGKIHEGSMEKGFRDSLINGDLDHFDMEGAPSELYVLKRPTGQDSELADQFDKLKDEIMDVVNKALDKSDAPDNVAEDQQDAIEAPATDTAEVQDSAASVQQAEEKEEEKEEVTSSFEDRVRALVESEKDAETMIGEIQALLLPDEEEVPEFVDDETIDWFVLETALDAMVDAKLSTEQREKLPAKSFCGPDRSFPVPDCAHVTAARRLIGRAKLSSDQKAKVLACVNRKAKNMSCDTEKDSAQQNCRCGEYDSLNNDYVEALKQVDSLRTKLAEVLEAHVKTQDSEVSLEQEAPRLDSLLSWFDNIEPQESKTTDSLSVETIQVVDNPSGASSEGKSPSRELGDFEKKIVMKYRSIRDKEGQEAADVFMRARRRYLPSTLDLTEYIN